MGFGSIVCGLVCGTVALSDKDSSSLIPNPDSKVSNRAIHPPRCAESVGDGSNGNSHPYQPDVSWIDIYSNELKPHPHRVGGHPIYTYPDAYKPRPHLATESGTAATGRRMHTILKPKIKGVRGRRELEFYTTVANYPLLKGLVPDLISVVKTKDGKEFLELQDLTQGFSLPVIIDIKIGRRTWGPDATAAKIRSAKTKYPYQPLIGFRIVGIKRPEFKPTERTQPLATHRHKYKMDSYIRLGDPFSHPLLPSTVETYKHLSSRLSSEANADLNVRYVTYGKKFGQSLLPGQVASLGLRSYFLAVEGYPGVRERVIGEIVARLKEIASR
ncbi:hypothetical protein AAMO2058_000873600 [Amorphochlora amoebiformis]